MYVDYPLRTIRIARSPLYHLLSAFPIACFTGTLATDIAYWRTAEMTWANFSAWLLAVGLVIGVLAWIVEFFDLLLHPLLRRMGAAWLQLLGHLVVLAVAFFNTLIHTRDAWTSVVPQGLALSAITVGLMFFIGLLSTTLVFRREVREVGVVEE
jgi:uncharacterized membrane protein